MNANTDDTPIEELTTTCEECDKTIPAKDWVMSDCGCDEGTTHDKCAEGGPCSLNPDVDDDDIITCEWHERCGGRGWRRLCPECHKKNMKEQGLVNEH